MISNFVSKAFSAAHTFAASFLYLVYTIRNKELIGLAVVLVLLSTRCGWRTSLKRQQVSHLALGMDLNLNVVTNLEGILRTNATGPTRLPF